MKTIRLICNPTSGRAAALDKALKLASRLVEEGHLVSLYKTTKPGDAYDEVCRSKDGPWDLFVAIGGDGTINEVAGGILDCGLSTPMGIMQEGTVNDIAKFLQMSSDPDDFVDRVNRWDIEKIDIGSTGQRYFMNVAAGGLFTSVAHHTPSELKSMLGRTAYYLEVMRELTTKWMASYPLRITCGDQVFEERFHLFIITNTPHVGGLDRVAPLAEIQDGLLDCIFVRETDSLQEAADIFWRVLRGEHIDHDKVLYLRTDQISVTSTDENDQLELDVDGEFAGHLPVNITVHRNAVRLLR